MQTSNGDNVQSLSEAMAMELTNMTHYMTTRHFNVSINAFKSRSGHREKESLRSEASWYGVVLQPKLQLDLWIKGSNCAQKLSWTAFKPLSYF